MKRSDMLNNMVFFYDQLSDVLNNKSTKDRMSDLLILMEAHGMSPPEYLPEPQHHDNGKQLEVKHVRKWEKE